VFVEELVMEVVNDENAGSWSPLIDTDCALPPEGVTLKVPLVSPVANV
jgi:hypothetical protein